jgi:hypothetical protein
VVAVLAVLAVVALLVWLLVIRDDRKSGTIPSVPTGSTVTVPAAVSLPSDAEGRSLLELMEKGRSLTFHATYKATGDPAVLPGELTIEVWRKGGKIRQDTSLKSDSGTAHTQSFVIDGKSLTCTQENNDPWSCSPESDPGTNVDGVFGSTAAQLRGIDVTARDDTVSGRAAKCFDFATADGAGTLCFTPDGLPLRLALAGQDLSLNDLQTSVDDAVFSPPAAPTASAASASS